MSKRTPKEVSLDEAAKRLGINPATAYRWAIAGKLRITTHVPRTAPRIWVDDDSVTKLERERAMAQ
jgi:predicted site-specific integrase-resolvase